MKKLLILLVVVLMGTPQVFAQKTSGYEGTIDFGYGIGLDDSTADFLHFSAINGYRFSPYFSVGLGTALRYNMSTEGLSFPLTAEFKGVFSNSKVAPFIGLGVGYTISVSPVFDGVGFLFTPSLGVQYKLNDAMGLNLSVGYSGQLYNDYWDEIDLASAITIKVGLVLF
ncbi:MAG: hypothetical protein FWH23_07280 [Bacteroidales bacterium]|nr:hypothetical protein [Bacteroidales bacterium]